MVAKETHTPKVSRYFFRLDCSIRVGTALGGAVPLFLNVKHTWWFGIRIEIEEAFHISSHSGRSRVSFAN